MGNDNVESMAKRVNNGMMQSPKAALEDALNSIGKKGSFKKGKKLVVLCLDDSDGQYKVSFIQAGMRMSECVALCDVSKSMFLDEMGY